MPKLVNGNTHAIRVRHPDGSLHRILPGQVVDADGAFADALTDTAGVSTATAEQSKAWDAKLDADRTRSAMPGDGSRLSSKLAIGPARAELRALATVAPLQRVVGDDHAPQGPASGTITTRGDAATSGDERDLVAFAQGEELVMQGVKVESPGADEHEIASGRATQSDIHNAQVDNAQVAEDAAKRFIEGEDDEAKPKGRGRAKSKSDAKDGDA